MSQFFIGNETVRADFPDSEWVDIKAELTQADQDYILNQMAHAEAVGDKAQVSMSLGRMALLERSVVAWSFKENDIPVPVNKENISNLRLKYRTKVLEEVNRITELATQFVIKNE